MTRTRKPGLSRRATLALMGAGVAENSKSSGGSLRSRSGVARTLPNSVAAEGTCERAQSNVRALALEAIGSQRAKNKRPRYLNRSLFAQPTERIMKRVQYRNALRN